MHHGCEVVIQVEEILYFSSYPLTLGPTQPRIHWVPRALSLGVKRPGSEADHSPLSSAVGAQLKKVQDKFTFAFTLIYLYPLILLRSLEEVTM
jgi:hypothetical protein